MKVLRTPSAVRLFVQALKKKGRPIGFVPTMGYLHEGHLSLVKRAIKENDAVIASIFVNPLQFGKGEDLKRYPRNLPRDIRLLKKAGTSALFLPGAEMLYPKDFQTQVRVKELSEGLCGKTRPTHFAGVATVVLKLLNLTAPDRLYLGLKDYQQYRVISRMVKDLDLPVQVVGCPIVREKDGLAMSSRNIFLNVVERQEALSIRRGLRLAQVLARAGERSAVKLAAAVRAAIKASNGARIDYVEIVDAGTLRPMVQLEAGRPALAAAAVYFRKTRLIDNCIIKV